MITSSSHGFYNWFFDNLWMFVHVKGEIGDNRIILCDSVAERRKYSEF